MSDWDFALGDYGSDNLSDVMPSVPDSSTTTADTGTDNLTDYWPAPGAGDSTSSGMFGDFSATFSRALDSLFGDWATDKAGDALSKVGDFFENRTVQKVSGSMLPAIGQAMMIKSLQSDQQKQQQRLLERQYARQDQESARQEANARWGTVSADTFAPVVPSRQVSVVQPTGSGLLASELSKTPQQAVMEKLALQEKLKGVR